MVEQDKRAATRSGFLRLHRAGALAGADVMEGIKYTSVEIQHLANDFRMRSALKHRGLDDGTTLLKVLAYVTRIRDGETELLVFDHRDALSSMCSPR